MESHKIRASLDNERCKFLQLLLLRCLQQDTSDFYTVPHDADNFYLVQSHSEGVSVFHIHLPEPRPLEAADFADGGELHIGQRLEGIKPSDYFIFTNCLTDHLELAERPDHEFNFSNLRETATGTFVDRIPSDLHLRIAEALRRFADHHCIGRFASQTIIERLYSYVKQTRSFRKRDVHLVLLDLFVSRYRVDLSYTEQSQFNEFWHEVTGDALVVAVGFDVVNDAFLKSHTVGVLAKSGDCSELAYKRQWLTGDVSLLILAQSADDYRNVVNILKAFSVGLRVTVLTDFECETVLHLKEDQVRRLLNCEVSLQGKSTVALGQLVDELQSLKCSDFVRLITKNFVIDYCYKKLPSYFIERGYFKVVFSLDTVNNLKDETFVVYNSSGDENFQLRNLENLPNVFVVGDNVSETIGQAKSRGGPVHYCLLCEDNWLEWKESWGCVDNVRKLQVSQEVRFTGEMPELLRHEGNRLHVLVMEPSTGSSTLLDSLALRTVDKWVISVDLSQYVCDYKPTTALGHLHQFSKQEDSELVRRLLDRLIETKKVQILFDNYDQSMLNHFEEVVTMIATLHEENYDMWITAGAKNASFLESRFNTVAVTVKPFNVQDQRDFLTKYFQQFDPSSNRTQEFAQALFATVRKAVDGFLDSPLYLTFVANSYVDDLKHFLVTGGLRLEENFALLDFLEMVLTSYVNYLTDKYDLCDSKFFSHRLPLLALRSVFEQADLKDFVGLEDGTLEEFAKGGIVETEFRYPIFAHFLVARWMFENVSVHRSWVRSLNKKRFFNLDRFRDAFKLFDLMLTKDLPIHAAIILGRIRSMPTTEYLGVDLTDTVGRNLVHMSALYGVFHPMNNTIRGVELDDILENIVKSASLKAILANDTLLSYSTLDYALSSGCLAIANAICERATHLVSNVYIASVHLESYVQYCIQVDRYNNLFKNLLKYLICSKVAASQLRENMEASNFAEKLDLGEMTQEIISNYVSGFSTTTLSHLMEILELKKPNCRYFNNLKLAAAFGSKDNIVGLLRQGAKINGLNNRSYTPLHAAVNHNRTDNVEVLLAIGAKINVIDPFGNTALHLACERHNPQLVKKLVQKGTDIGIQNDEGDTTFHHALKHGCEQSAELFLPDNYYALFFSPQTSISRDRCLDVNMQNKNGDTPLLLALKHGCGSVVRQLLEYNADVNIVNKSGSTCLHYAAEVDDYKTALELSYLCVDINAIDDDGQTPLLIALSSLSVRIARLLLSKGARVTDVTKLEKITCLHHAIRIGLMDLIRIIVERGADINAQNAEEESPLCLALAHKNMDAVLFLLERGADPNLVDRLGGNALHHAIANKQLNALETLIEHGCQIDHQDHDGDTPLIAAAREYYVGAVKTLLSKGADVNVVNSNGSSCLHVGIYLFRLVRLLLDVGLDVNKKNNEGNTPFLLAVENRTTHIINHLISNGADIFVENNSGFSAIHYAARYDLVDLICELLNRGVDVNKKSFEGHTPLLLHITEWYTNWKTVKLLLEKGADVHVIDSESGNSLLHLARSDSRVVRTLLKTAIDVDLRNNEGVTALHAAVSADYTGIIKLLLSKGADVNVADNAGNTCLHVAIGQENEDLVKLLLKYGAKGDIANNSGETPLGAAERLGCSNILRMLGAKACQSLFQALDVCSVKTLINSDNINEKNQEGNTPLLVALKKGYISIVDFLLSQDPDVTVSNEEGATALHYAVELGDVKIIQRLLEGGCKIDTLNNDGDSALSLAIFSSRFHIAQLLFNCGANIPSNRKGHYLYGACKNGSDEIALRILESGCDLDAFGENGSTPLISALSNRHRRIAIKLIESGADLTIVDIYEDSALSHATNHQFCDIVNLLLDKGVVIDGFDENSSTPLKNAISNEKREVVKLLLARGANVHLGDDWSRYPLHAAASNDMVDIASIILDAGFDIDKGTKSDGTAVYVAAERRNFATTSMLISNGASLDTFSDNFSSMLTYAAQNGWEELVRERIKKGDDVRHKNNDHDTPLDVAISQSKVSVVKLLFAEILAQDNEADHDYLHIAAQIGDNKIVAALLDKGFDINGQLYDGETPLVSALRKENLSTAKLLLSRGADYNIGEYEEGYSCLHYFAQYGWDDWLLKMLDEGADVHTKTNSGDTPLSLATQSRRISTVKLLLAHGADPTVENNNDDTPLELCVRHDYKQIFKAFLDKIDIDKHRKLLQSAAFSAMSASNYGLVDELVKLGVENFHSSNGESTLSMAVETGQRDFVRHSLSGNCNVDEVNFDGDTLIALAVKKEDVDMVRLLLEYGADVNIPNLDGDVCLHHATSGTEEVIALLWERGNAELKNEDGLTPLLYALKSQYTNSAQLLISFGVDTQTEDLAGNTCLHYAVMTGSEELVKYFLDNGLDVRKKNIYGDDCFDLAINNGRIGVMKQLISHGCDPHRVNRFGENCLLKAVEEGDEFVAELLDKGVDVNCQCARGYTPFTMALQSGNGEYAKILLAKNVDVRIRNRSGSNLHYAILQGVDVVAELLDLGLDVDEQDDTGSTPLLLAAKSSTAAETVKLLLERGANVHLIDNERNSCLHNAIDQSDADVLSMLIEKGVDLNCWNTLGETPLLKALKNYKLEFAELLLGYGADCTVTDNENGTCLTYAAKCGYADLLRMFISKGIDVNQVHAEGTPLLQALKNSEVTAAKILLESGADIYSCNSYTPWTEYVISLHNVEIVELLLAKGMDVNLCLSQSEPLLVSALKEKYKPLVDFLISKGADVFATNFYTGESCLHYAAIAGYNDVVAVLLDRGLDIDRENNERQTPLRAAFAAENVSTIKLLLSRGASIDDGNIRESYLHQAIRLGDNSIVADLIDKGADLNAQNADGCTPIVLAVSANDVDMVQLLLNKGADYRVKDECGRNLLQIARSVEGCELVEEFVKLGIDDEMAVL